MVDMDECIFVIFKFGGQWTQVKKQDRKIYEGGKQKSVKIEKDLISFYVLKEKVEAICPWLKGRDFELHYYVNGTSPKRYNHIVSDIEVMNMMTQLDGSDRAEVVVTQDGNDEGICLQSKEISSACDMLKRYHPNSNDIGVHNFVEAYDDDFLITQGEGHKTLSVGASYHNSFTFKQALRTEAIKNNFSLKIKASNRVRVVAICSFQGCPWRVRAKLCADGQTFEVTKLESTHSCPGVNRAGNKQATSDWVADQIQEIVRMQPNISPKEINNNLERMFGLSLSYMKLWRSRERARDSIFGLVDDNYKWVPTMRSELISRNPGSHVTYTYSEHDLSFKRFFVSFRVCIDGFLIGCRHLVGLDACHLKSKYLGVLLSANSLDGNNGLFTLAFAVAETESKNTWGWFLENLSESLGSNFCQLAFISDMEKGLCEAVKIVFPNAEHRVCMRHLWKNMKKSFHFSDNHRVRDLVWSAANAYTKHQFDVKVKELFNICPQVHSYMLALPYKWSRSQFSNDIKNHYNTNNMAESFNSWIGEARSKPVVDLIDTIRAMLMEQRAERKLTSLGWRGELVPQAEEYIRDVSTRKEHFIIRQSTCNKAEVEGILERNVVDIDNRECTCAFWQLSGLPCIHAIAVIGMKEYPLWHTYVDDHFHVTRYQMAYDGPISALPGKDQWTIDDDEVQLGVPNTIRPRGRPKKSRLKNFLEVNKKKTKILHRCSRCCLWGHHRTTCKNPLTHSTTHLSEVEQATFNSEQTSIEYDFREKLPIRRDNLQ